MNNNIFQLSSFLSQTLWDAVVVAPAEDTTVDNFQTSNVKFVLNLGTLPMFAILGLMWTFSPIIL